MYALLGACLVLAAHACEVCQHKLFAGGCPVGRRKARERWGDWVVTDDAFDDRDCEKTCCAATEKSCCETDFNFVAGVAGGLFVLIAICACGLVMTAWTQPAPVKVIGHTWERSITRLLLARPQMCGGCNFGRTTPGISKQDNSGRKSSTDRNSTFLRSLCGIAQPTAPI